MSIVVGYTGPAESVAALELAAEESLVRKAALHVVQTLREAPSENPSQTRQWADRIEGMRQEGAREQARLRERGIDAQYQLLQTSTESSAQQLLNYAKEVDAALIVIGLRRRSPVGKLVLGSMEQDVLLGADCPVLAVKAPTE